MAKISQKQVREIEYLTIFTEVIQSRMDDKIAGVYWFECRPEMWDNEHKLIYDLMSELEEKLKTKIINILKPC